MAKKQQAQEREGAPSVIEEDQTSFTDDESRTGKHYDGGRKVIDLDHVGAGTPDADDEDTTLDDREGGAARAPSSDRKSHR